MEKFVHLHVHTQYSLLDGATRVEELFARCGELGMPAVAITDHGNMYGVLEFVKKAVYHTDPSADFYEFIAKKREFKVKPIVGCEFYIAKDMNEKVSDGGKMPRFNHLVLLCKNEIGYKNLVKLVSKGFTEGFYYKPRIDMELLKKHSEGLICLSACLAGSIPQAVLNKDFDEADKLAKDFKSLFGEDFYIEIQDHNIKDQKTVLPHLITLAKNNDIKLVATNDVHYLNKKDWAMQKVLQCISFRNTHEYNDFTDEGSAENQDIAAGGADDGGYFPTHEFYLKSRPEMAELFSFALESLDNTIEVADKCECYFFQKEQLLPNFQPSDGSTPLEFLRRLTMDGLKKKYKVITDEILDRAEYELKVIGDMGFLEYYLIVWDFIHYAERSGIPVGPGRGSGVGSIVAYAIGITKVDPIKYELIFERFLNPERVSSPDFDIDFCVDRRDEVIDYVMDKYGADNVSQIITFGTLAAKAAVKDVGRVFNQPYAEVEKITKLIPSMMGKNHIGHLIGLIPGKSGEPNPVVPELKEMYETDVMTKNIIDMAMRIEGMPRQTGMHAAGVIICKDEIYNHVPLSRSSENDITTEFNMVECEELGLLKMDFLGLRTLTDIKNAIEIIKETKNEQIDFYDMEYDNDGVFELIGEGDTHAVFQLESEGMKRFMRELKPTCLEDIIAGVSLYRPGPMDKIPEYVYGKRHPDKIKYDHPLLEPILNVTYGVMVYQEQVMKTVQVLAGYTLGRADELRRIMSKKKKDKMEIERQVFLYGINDKGVQIPGAIKNGVPKEVANKIFDDMTSFASYAFNKSHAAAYAYLAYQTAYLKKYYTVEFIAAVLNNRISNIDEITNYLTYLKERDIAVLPPDINKSKKNFSVENGAVRIGLAAIKNVGASVIEEIVKEREKGGDYKDFLEFVTRIESVTLSKRLLSSLIYAGAFDCFKRNRSQLIQVHESVLSRASKERHDKLNAQFSFFDDDAFKKTDVFVYPETKEFDIQEKLRFEKEVAGVYLTGHPLDGYKDFLKGFKFNTLMLRQSASGEDSEEGEADETVLSVKDGDVVSLAGILTEATKKLTKSGKELGIGRIEDLYGTCEIVASQYILLKSKDLWQKDKGVVLTGKVRERDGEISIWVDKLEPFILSSDTVQASPVKKICACFSFAKEQQLIMDKLQSIFAFYDGNDDCYVKNLDDGKVYSLGLKTRVCDLLVYELMGMVGEQNVKVL